jgi:tetratricopeptide (TPR) repeat protein
MTEERMNLDEFHKKIAKETNNSVWPILDKARPTQADLEQALDMAYASRYHWSKVGEPINLARADYNISRVYSAMGRAEPALYHAKRCLRITEDAGVGDWDLAFAYEALTRMYAVARNKTEYEKYRKLTLKAMEDIREEEDRNIVKTEFDKIRF